MAHTKHQTVITPSTGNIAIYVWQEGQGASGWQVAFQQPGGETYWQMWMERYALLEVVEEMDIVLFPTLATAIRDFQGSPVSFDLPDTLVAEARN